MERQTLYARRLYKDSRESYQAILIFPCDMETYSTKPRAF